MYQKKKHFIRKTNFKYIKHFNKIISINWHQLMKEINFLSIESKQTNIREEKVYQTSYWKPVKRTKNFSIAMKWINKRIDLSQEQY